MADFSQENTRIDTLVRILKAELSLSIWDDKGKKMLFDGKVYQLYDNKELHRLRVENMLISFDRVSVSVQD